MDGSQSASRLIGAVNTSYTTTSAAMRGDPFIFQIREQIHPNFTEGSATYSRSRDVLIRLIC
jgi:hypothetical protein